MKPAPPVTTTRTAGLEPFDGRSVQAVPGVEYVARVGPHQVVVEGVNRVKKHIRRSQKYPQGGVLSKEMPVQLSNVKYVCPSCGAATRLGARFLDDGSKERTNCRTDCRTSE